ncbi:rod shape-determining protein MreD [Nostocoides sp. HKS02]|uniref:rod shape-determining protein MreD n=1 Tax=Nostocoides sp. HKS02 TaxID=1813880 RepID=UPI001E50E9E8|nr:rod shape-determining protein MreD [Tetrasphaera sp. HKS02]
MSVPRVVALRALMLLVAALLSVTIAVHTPDTVPDLVLPVVVAGALLGGPSRGGLVGLGAGWLVDLLPPGPSVLGTSALLYAAVGLLAGTGRREGPTPWGWVALVGAASAVALGTGRVVVAVVSGAAVDPTATGLGVLWSAALCAIAVPPLVWVEQSVAGRRRR